MALLPRYQEVLDELVEWWEDVSDLTVDSRAVLVAVPDGWGPEQLAATFAAYVMNDAGRLGILVSLDGVEAPTTQFLQARYIAEKFYQAGVIDQLPDVLGFSRMLDRVQIALGVAGLFVTELPALVGMLAASFTAGVAERTWDARAGGQDGLVARIARRATSASKSIPVVVILANAEQLLPDLGYVLIEQLLEQVEGRVLAIAFCPADSELFEQLVRRVDNRPLARVRVLDVNTSMEHIDRAELAHEAMPWLPGWATSRIAERLFTFADVLTLGDEEALRDVDRGNRMTAEAALDKIIDAALNRKSPSWQATILWWLGGIATVSQLRGALGLLGREFVEQDPSTCRIGELVYLRGVGSRRFDDQMSLVSEEKRRGIALATLEQATLLLDPADYDDCLYLLAAGKAVQTVREHLAGSPGIARVIAGALVCADTLGEAGAVLEFANTLRSEHGELLTHLDKSIGGGERLAERLRDTAREDRYPTIASQIVSGSIWQAIVAVGIPQTRETALRQLQEIVRLLNAIDTSSQVASQWRLIIAAVVARLGHSQLAATALAPTIAGDADSPMRNAAVALLASTPLAVGDRLIEIALLEAALASGSLPHEDVLRLNEAIAAAASKVGDLKKAHRYAAASLALSGVVRGPLHTKSLEWTVEVAYLTEETGDPNTAIRMLEPLLARPEMDQARHRRLKVAATNVLALSLGDGVAPV